MLLNLWATWCPACREELPALAEAIPTLDRLGVGVVAVSIDTKSGAAVAEFLRVCCRAMPFRVLQDPEAAALSARRADGTLSPFQRWRMPITFAVDPRGLVRGYIPGRVDWLSPDGVAFLSALRS